MRCQLHNIVTLSDANFRSSSRTLYPQPKLATLLTCWWGQNSWLAPLDSANASFTGFLPEEIEQNGKSAHSLLAWSGEAPWREPQLVFMWTSTITSWSPAENPDYAPELMPLIHQNGCSSRQKSALSTHLIVCLLFFLKYGELRSHFLHICCILKSQDASRMLHCIKMICVVHLTVFCQLPPGSHLITLPEKWALNLMKRKIHL